jgi:hypothetical protein
VIATVGTSAQLLELKLKRINCGCRFLQLHLSTLGDSGVSRADMRIVKYFVTIVHVTLISSVGNKKFLFCKGCPVYPSLMRNAFGRAGLGCSTEWFVFKFSVYLFTLCFVWVCLYVSLTIQKTCHRSILCCSKLVLKSRCHHCIIGIESYF